MNPPSSDPRKPEPLMPEERALAARLARIGPHDGPSPALDTKILAAAHAAAAQQTRSTSRRWPALLGIAATLALAVGMVWQLRPMSQAPPVQDEVPRSEAASATASDQAAPGGAAMAPADDAALVEDHAVPAARSAPPAEATHAPIAANPATSAANAEPSRRERSTPLPAIEPAVAAKMQRTAPTSPPPAESAPMAFPDQPTSRPPPPAPASRAAGSTAGASAKAGYAAPTTQESRAVADAMQGESRREQVTATDSAAANAPASAVNLPIDHDHLLDPIAWLDRIRERRDAGDLAGARTSLARFRRIHPQLVVPEDLRALADDPADR